MHNVIHFFLTRHSLQLPQSLLIGLSGGPDSLALLHLLLPYREQITLHVAHVNHGWRPESGEEENLLEQMVRQLRIPWHCKRLDPTQLKGNLEAACREARHLFFKELCHIHHCDAVLLGHHADDQAETVLKRVFESTWLPFLGGLRPITTIDGLTIWRPLLYLKKQEILDWLKAQNLSAFDDHTNRDPRLMRGRMRMTIIPTIDQHFGKSIAGSLCRLGDEAQELQTYMERQVAPYIAKIYRDEQGVHLNLSEQMPESLFELRYLVRALIEAADLVPFYQAVGAACELLKKEGKYQVSFGPKTLHIHRRKLFIPHSV